MLLPLPSRTIELPRQSANATIAAGAIHIHTSRSDGSGTGDEAAEAAARAGLQFIVLTDHGDGTRVPDPPRYRSGVLVIDGVELSTQRGHYIAIGLPQAPYPLRGEPRDVVADVRRLGGFGIVAHPDSAKPPLQWRDWAVPFDAMEWLNADTEWRDETATQLARAVAQYPVVGAAALGSLLDRPAATLARWDALTRQRRVVALAGADAHARTGWTDEDQNVYLRGWFLKIPSYEVSFRTFTTRVVLDHPLSSDAAADAAQVIGALKGGRTYSAVDAVASPATLEFTASAGIDTVTQGSVLRPHASVMFKARTNAPARSIFVLLKDGQIVTRAQNPDGDVTFEATGGAGTYRVEVHVPNSPGTPPVPWVVSNPIYVHPDGWGAAPEPAYPRAAHTRIIQGGPWHIEKDAASTARLAHSEPAGAATLTYRLGGGDRGAQYAALAIGIGTALTEATRLAFRASATRPMRISVQARRPMSGERWQRSVYLDTNPREVTVAFNELTAVADTAVAFDPRLTDTLLFVADLTNAHPGTSGEFTIAELRLER